MSTIDVTDEFRQICREIIADNKTDEEWSLVESDDMFQSPLFCGGYDATGRFFAFEYRGRDDGEYWCFLTLAQVHAVANGELRTIEIERAD